MRIWGDREVSGYSGVRVVRGDRWIKRERGVRGNRGDLRVSGDRRVGGARGQGSRFLGFIRLSEEITRYTGSFLLRAGK